MKALLASEPRDGIESTELDRCFRAMLSPVAFPVRANPDMAALSSGVTLDIIVNLSFSDTPVELLK